METVEDLLGPAPPETIEGLLGPPPKILEPSVILDGESFDYQFSEGRPGYLLDVFGQGIKRGWGAHPADIGPETQKFLRDIGLFNDYEKSRSNVIKQFNEAMLRSTALAAHSAIRSLPALVYGFGDVAVELGVPRDIPGMFEAFPAGRLTGMPARVRPNMPQLIERSLLLEEARDLGVLEGTSPTNMARERFAPTGEPTPTERVVRPLEPTSEAAPTALEGAAEAIPETSFTTMEPVDVHAIARLVDPQTFREFDALAEQKQTFTRWLEELEDVRRQDPRVIAAEKEIATILGKVRGVEERLTKRAADRLAEIRGDLENFLRTETPDMQRVRRERQKVDEKMRDLAEPVSAAYRRANEEMPRAETVTEGLVREPREVAPLVEEVAVPDAAVISETVGEPTTPNIVNLSQRRPTIARDVEQQLVNAGRPVGEARAAGTLVQAHYEARAARFEGALGSARDLYDAEAPSIRRVPGRVYPGQITPRLNEIRLFDIADSSTFLHETGHNWLFELERDAAHPKAPLELKQDMEAVRAWLGAEDGKPFTRKMHETWARGFERYLMEGLAPTQRLASVFEKFKQWLVDKYQTVTRLRSPINDDIRGVYDRLLSTPSREAVIAPERPGALDLATAHEQVARETPAAQALEAADRLRMERDRVAETLTKALEDGRRNARRGPTRSIVAGEGEAPGRIVNLREEPASTDAPIDTGRVAAAGKGEAGTASTERFTDVTSDYLDRAGNIRLDNLDTAGDVTMAIREAAREGGEFVQERRGVMSDVEVRDLADDLGVAAQKLNKREIGEAFNAEEIVSFRRLLVKAAEDVRDTMTAAAGGDMKAIIAYALARERLLLVQGQVAGVTAEAGRALRAFKSLKGEVGDANLMASFFQQNLGRTARELQLEAQGGLKMESRAQINKYVRDAAEPSWKEKVVEVRINSLLSGPYTHIRNLIGNTATALNAIPETALAAAITKVRGRGNITFAEVNDRIAGTIQGAQEGVVAFKAAMGDESYMFDRATQAEGYRPAIGGTTGQVVRFPGRTLSAEDAGYKALARRQELNVQARRQATAEGLTGAEAEARVTNLVRDLPTPLEIDKMVKDAETQLLRDQAAGVATVEQEVALRELKITQDISGKVRAFEDYQTFTNPLGPTGQRWLGVIDSMPLLRLIFPFNRTPINIMKYAVERTPFGLAMQSVRDNLVGRNGIDAQNMQIARLTLGSMMMTGVVGFTLGGQMTGGGPYTAPEREVWGLDGKIPYAARFGNTWVSHQNAVDPFGINIALASDLAEVGKYAHRWAWNKDDDATFDKLMWMTVYAFSRDIFSKLNFRGASDLFSAIMHPEMSMEKYLRQQGASLVPAIVGQTADMTDPIKRDARTMLDALRARIPYLREDLRSERDLWGEPVPQENFGPFKTSEARNDPVNALMERLGMSKAAAGRKLEQVDLTPQQYDDYERLSGRMAKIMLDKQLPYIERMPSQGMQREIITKLIDQARKMARAQVMMGSMGGDNDLVVKGREQRLKVLH